jgi:ABC-type nitrate/sulfonate/bicarbonate transport system permease component
VQWVFVALRTSVSFGLPAVPVGEFVGATGGLGCRMSIFPCFDIIFPEPDSLLL